MKIEEMARDLCECFNSDGTCYCDDKPCNLKCEEFTTAQYLYEKGYRKQAWISVEERLPKKWKHVLCYYPEKDYGSKVVVDYAETDDGYFAEQFQYGKPSHWMPLPEGPKGGAE